MPDKPLTKETIFGLTMNVDGYAEVIWRDDEGMQSAELDPNSPEVKKALRVIRSIIWGNDV